LFFSVFIISITSHSLLITSVCGDEKKTREFRPLEAKQISILPQVRVDRVSGSESESQRLLGEAWKQFDSRQWSQATDLFLTALEKDPRNQLAAEGLAMSVYRSGDYGSSFKLGKELKPLMPSVQELISETVVADVQYMISKGELDAAKEFMSFFPSTDAQYGRAHELLTGARIIARSLGPDGDTTIEPPSDDIQDLARN
ncbi:MAG: hypothetical protein AAGA96_19250, partial [Verrucomicrobiota bacterium]